MTTFLLVHGAWTGGWIWGPLARRLRAQGHEVFTPTLTGVGERAHLARPEVDLETHVQDILAVIDCEELRDLALVGFSYGGMIAGVVADRLPDRIARLIYVDAFVPTDGISMLDLMPPPARAAVEAQVQNEGEGWRLGPLPLAPLGRLAEDAAGTEEEILRRLARRAPQPARTFSQPSRLTHPRPPVTPGYIHCADKAPPDPLAPFAQRAQEAGWRCRELRTGHFAALTAPGDLLRALLDFSA
jgi:pimeloyl-ACP methyl ester carboxylesterase